MRDPEAEPKRRARLADEEEAIASKYDMPPDWTLEEFEQGAAWPRRAR